MKIYITDNVKAPQSIKKIIKDCVNASVSKLYNGANTEFEVSVMLVDNDEIQNLNFLHRNMDKPTDVLSFPMLEFYENGNIAEENAEYNEYGDILLGDIVINMQRAEEQARDYGHSLEREVGFLTVHSMLHLFGYDHENETEEKEMFGLQEEILLEMGIVR